MIRFLRKMTSLLVLLSVLVMLYPASGYAAGDRPSQRVSTAHFSDGVPILMYHKVNPDPATGGQGLRVHPLEFETQMAYLYCSGYKSISLANLADHSDRGMPLPPRPVIITFDDGYQDNFTYAYPILKKYQMTATIFVVAGTVGDINQFDFGEGTQPLNKMADLHQLKEMARGGITIGCHTMTHPHLAGLKKEEARHEITESKKQLETLLNTPVEFFCYPYGSYDRDTLNMVRESGFRAAVTTQRGLGRYPEEAFALKRIRVRGDYSLVRFLQELARYHNTYF